MHSVVGIFPVRDAAERAANALALPHDRVSIVAPGPRQPDDAGIGPALGGAVGAALGAAAGSSLGTAAATLMIPGVGPVIATGVVAALVLGAGGAAAGAAAGKRIEDATEHDPTENPRDLFFFHESLRRGRAIVLALADTAEQAESIRGQLANAGGESLDTTREAWWRDVRETESAGYSGDFAPDEEAYRSGFEDALEPANQDKTAHHTAVPPYQRGFERGREYFRKLISSGSGAMRA